MSNLNYKAYIIRIFLLRMIIGIIPFIIPGLILGTSKIELTLGIEIGTICILPGAIINTIRQLKAIRLLKSTLPQKVLNKFSWIYIFKRFVLSFIVIDSWLLMLWFLVWKDPFILIVLFLGQVPILVTCTLWIIIDLNEISSIAQHNRNPTLELTLYNVAILAIMLIVVMSMCIYTIYRSYYGMF